MPLTLRVAIGLLWLQFLALLTVFVIFVYLVIREPSALGAYVGIFTAICTGVLLLIIMGLNRLKSAARGAVLAIELLALAPAYYMVTGGQPVLGSLVGVSALAICGLLLAPASSRALGV